MSKSKFLSLHKIILCLHKNYEERTFMSLEYTIPYPYASPPCSCDCLLVVTPGEGPVPLPLGVADPLPLPAVDPVPLPLIAHASPPGPPD